MQKRPLSLILLVILFLLQYPLWFGKGGWFRVWVLERGLESQRATNHDLQVRNQQLEGEVNSLKEGMDAVEERARYDLGMVKPNEIYVQVVKPQIGPRAAPATGLLPPAPEAHTNKPAPPDLPDTPEPLQTESTPTVTD
ncbi:MAG: cell division protein FtsB [Burkholderiaceae bacterium]